MASRRRSFLVAPWVVALHLATSSAQPLEQLFRDPPREYTLAAFWSWNSTLVPEKLRWQIDQMIDKGVYAAFMHARDGLDQSQTPYFSPGFWEAVRVSVEHARRRRFQTWIYDEDKWPSGAAGGRTIAANPERFRARGLTCRTQIVKGPATLTLHFPDAVFLVAARPTGPGAIDPATLTDLTEPMRSGKSWNVPEGPWILCIFEPVRGRENLPNYLNPNMVAEFIRNTYEEYARRFSREFGRTIPGSFFDEIFNLPLAWDPLLEERFLKNKGYELRTALPLLYLWGGPRTIKVRCDYFEEFTRLYEEAWFQQLAGWCERHRLQLTGHTNEGLYNIRDQGDYFRTWRHVQIPGTDNEDFRYTFPRVIGAWKPKQLASVTHVYGKHRAMVEALGGAGWAITLEEARYGVNLLAAYGLNFFVFHLFHYAMDTPESMDDWPNSWFYQNPYWKYFKQLADHVRRLSFLGSQGQHVADIAVLYPVEDVWSLGLTEPPKGRPGVVEVIEELVRLPWDCDLVDTDSLIQASSTGQGARIGNEVYRVLVLPDVETVSLPAYRRVAALAQSGLEVVALRDKPRHSAERGADDPEVIEISERLFGDGQRVFPDVPALARWLRGRLQPDVDILSGPQGILRYHHRRIGSREVYLLANSERRPAQWRLRFRAQGKAERWDPETGAITTLPSLSPDGSILELDFQPWEAYYVVFRPGEPPAPTPAPRPAATRTLELEGPWTLQLAPHELDYRWTPEPGETLVELPVVDFRWERDGPLPPWRRVKVWDPLNPLRGVSRYLSAWDAHWITRYEYDRHPGQLGGAVLHFTKEVDLDFEPVASWLAVVADGQFELTVNGVPIAKGEPLAPQRFEALPFRKGRNWVELEVRGNGYLLAQGGLKSSTGSWVGIYTDRTWQVARPGEARRPAFEFCFPPFGRWGEPGLAGRPVSLPGTVWYRVLIPPGAFWLETPKVAGDFRLLVGGREIARAAGGFPVPPQGELLLQVRVQTSQDGLLAPLRFRCRPTPAKLGDWQSLGLDWYSGRAIYRTEFTLPPDWPRGQLLLDLGEVRYAAEVWVNRRLAGVRVWPPYQFDIGPWVQPGKNELAVVVANLLANEMRWNIYDRAVDRPVSRWWHDGNILREPEKLRSGLIGPVRLELRQVSGPLPGSVAAEPAR